MTREHSTHILRVRRDDRLRILLFCVASISKRRPWLRYAPELILFHHQYRKLSIYLMLHQMGIELP